MEKTTLVAQKNVSFHGVWKPKHTVTDALIKSIGINISTIASRPCKFVLTTSGLTLVLLSGGDGKKGISDQLPFDNIKDIVINKYNPKCLLVIYIDATNKFRVMSFSSQIENDLLVIAKSYKESKTAAQQNSFTRSHSHTSLNLILRKQKIPPEKAQAAGPKDNSKHINLHSFSLTSGSVSSNRNMLSKESYGTSQRTNTDESFRRFSDSNSSIMDDSVFAEPRRVLVHDVENLTREAVHCEGRPPAFSVGVQTLPTEDESDTSSVISSNSIQALNENMMTLTEEMNAVKFLLEKSTGISAEEHYGRGHFDNSRYRNSNDNSADECVLHGVNDYSCVISSVGNGVTINGEDCQLRSIGMQTIQNTRTGRRYAKKQANPTILHANKEKMTYLRSRSSSLGGPQSPGSPAGGPSVSFNLPPSNMVTPVRSSTSSGNGRQRSAGPPPGISRPAPRSAQSTSNTAAKPGQNIYQGKLARKSKDR